MTPHDLHSQATGATERRYPRVRSRVLLVLPSLGASVRFRSTHAVALLLGIVGGWFIATCGPIEADKSPRVSALVNRLHRQTVARASSDSALKAYRVRDSIRSQRIASLEAESRSHLRTSQALAGSNRRLTDSLRSMIRDSATLVLVANLDSGIAAADRACTLAVSTCQQAADSLKVQLVERDSIVADVRSQRDSSLSLATDAVGLARRQNKQLWVWRVTATVAAVIALLR